MPSQPRYRIARDSIGLSRSGGSPISITNPDKLIWHTPRVTKRDLLRYYALIWPRLRPFLAGRPLTVKRCPTGDFGRCFIQKDFDAVPRSVNILDILAQTTGEVIQVPTIEEESGLLWLGQIAAVELHGWLSRMQKGRERFSSQRGLLGSSLNRPDILVFDLDPPKEGGDFLRSFRAAAAAAERIHAFCMKRGVMPFCKTSGKFGVHLWIPIRPTVPFQEARERFRFLSERISKEHPDVFTLAQHKAGRRGRILLDFAQNSIGRTTVLPWSPRAIDDATISMPLRASELRTADPRKFTIPWALNHFSKAPDPWQGFFRKPYAWGQVERLIG